MRQNIFYVSVMFLLCLSNLTLADEYLLRVDNLLDKNFTVIEQIDEHSLILADDYDILRLEDNKISYIILDKNPLKNFYLLVYLFGEDSQTVSQYGDILDTYEIYDGYKCVLIRTTEEKVLELNRLKVELKRLTFDPVRFLTDDPYPLKINSFAPDTLIQKMVAAVSQDSIEASILRMQRMYTRFATTDSNKIVAVNWIKNRLLSYGCDSVYFQYFSNIYGPNVIGIKKGYLYPSVRKYCLIGGHLDCVPPIGYAPGADDNASGVTAVLEAARVMKDYLFENTIYYVAFNAEEVGLVGSDAFADHALQNNDTILGVFNFDMIGYVTPENPNRDTMNAHYTIAVPGCSLFVCQFFQAVADTYTQLKIRQVRNTGTHGPSDHASFWRRGYKAMHGIERVITPEYHTIGDTLGPHLYKHCGVNHLPFATKVIQTGVAALAKLAVPVHTHVGLKEQRAVRKEPFIIYPTLGTKFMIHFSAENNKQPEILVYNALGQIVCQIRPESKNIATWNGKDDKGNLVPAGVYFMLLKDDEKVFIRRVVYIR